MTVGFKVMEPCSLVDGHQHFGGTSFYPEDRGSRFLRIVSAYPPNYTASHSRPVILNGCAARFARRAAKLSRRCDIEKNYLNGFIQY
jgi:hypothetical protein